MGIKVNKMIGYGLTDVVKKDPRINWKKFEEYDFDYKGYEKWLVKESKKKNKNQSFHAAMELSLLKNHENKNLRKTDCYFHYDDEFGLENVFCIVPLFHYQWWRRDDDLDYVEEASKYAKDKGNWFKVFGNGFYPYNASFMDARTGKPLGEFAFEYYKQKRGKLNRSWLLDKLKFATVEEADQYIVPAIPECIQMMCKFTKIFKKISTINSLRPIEYCYWS